MVHPQGDDGKAGRPLGRILIGAPDPSLARFGGLVVAGELSRQLDLARRIDHELSLERRARPVKVRRRGVSPGELVLALAESQLIGGEFFSDLEEVRADDAGACLRIVSQTPSAPAALQRAKDFRRVHCQRVERALAQAGHQLDRLLGRDRSMEFVTVDLDATQIEVYGRTKQGAARNRQGQLSYAPHIAFWGQTGRALTAELVGGNREKLSGAQCARIARRAKSLLPTDHGPLCFRIDSAYYQLELLNSLRAERACFTVSVPRNQAMWKALSQIPEDAWTDALDMAGSQVAQTTYTPDGWKHEPLRLIIRRSTFTAAEIAKHKGSRRLKTIHPQQLQLALDGQLDCVYGYSFILTDIHWAPATWIEHFHRHRAQIEERLKDSKLGQALRHLPSGDQHANRVWLTAALLAVNLTAFCCDLCPAAGASTGSDTRPQRRHAKALRNLLFCIPLRIVRTGRQLILRPPSGFRHSSVLQDTLDAVHALGP
ncbi:MAG: IS1380 family transposase [Solirubrobacteraceae bacterium]